MRKRVAVSLALWLFCLPALALSLSMAIGGGYDAWLHIGDPSDKWLEAHQTGGWGASPLYVAAVAIVHAWASLLVMTIAWIRQRRVHRWWPISGTAAGIVGLLAFSVSLGPAAILAGVVYALPGMLFATFLCRYHLTPDMKS